MSLILKLRAPILGHVNISGRHGNRQVTDRRKNVGTTFESEVAFTFTVYFLAFSWLWISLKTTSFFFVPATVIAYTRQKWTQVITTSGGFLHPVLQQFRSNQIPVFGHNLHTTVKGHTCSITATSFLYSKEWVHKILDIITQLIIPLWMRSCY